MAHNTLNDYLAVDSVSPTAASVPLSSSSHSEAFLVSTLKSEFSVEGMTCSSCVATVEKASMMISGVEKVRVNLLAGKMEVIHSSSLSPVNIAEEIESIGFDVAVLASNPIASNKVPAVKQKTRPKDRSNLRVQSLAVEGMTCSSCVSTIERTLKGIDGVNSVAVSLLAGKAEVKYLVETVKNPNIFVSNLEDVGFDARVISDYECPVNARTSAEQSADSSNSLNGGGENVESQVRFSNGIHVPVGSQGLGVAHSAAISGSSVGASSFSELVFDDVGNVLNPDSDLSAVTTLWVAPAPNPFEKVGNSTFLRKSMEALGIGWDSANPARVIPTSEWDSIKVLLKSAFESNEHLLSFSISDSPLRVPEELQVLNLSAISTSLETPLSGANRNISDFALKVELVHHVLKAPLRVLLLPLASSFVSSSVSSDGVVIDVDIALQSSLTPVIQHQPSAVGADTKMMKKHLQQEQLGWRSRFILSLYLSVPTLLMAMILPYAIDNYAVDWGFFANVRGLWVRDVVLFFLSLPVQFGVGLRFYKGAWKSIKGVIKGKGVLGMEFLICAGTTAAFIVSLLIMGLAVRDQKRLDDQLAAALPVHEDNHTMPTVSAIPTYDPHSDHEHAPEMASLLSFSPTSTVLSPSPTVSAAIYEGSRYLSHVVSELITESKGISGLSSYSDFVDPSVIVGGRSLSGGMDMDGDPTLVHKKPLHIYFETSVLLIMFVMLGKWLESLAKLHTSDALSELVKLKPQFATVVTEKRLLKNVPSKLASDEFGDNISTENTSGGDISSETVFLTTPLDLVYPGDVLMVPPGASIPCDGVVLRGTSEANEALITGEPLPVPKASGSSVVGASVNGTGVLFVRVQRTAGASVLAQIVKLVEEAQMGRAPIQSFADRISAVFAPAVLILSVLTFVIWMLLVSFDMVDPRLIPAEQSHFTFSLLFAVAVLVIACPCALGLAVPTAVMVGTGVGAGRGLLFKGGEAFEALRGVSVVALDKTGTLTEGKPSLSDFIVFPEARSSADIGIVALPQVFAAIVAAESASEHPLARAITEGSNFFVDYLNNQRLFENKRQKNTEAKITQRFDEMDLQFNVENFESIPGRGLKCSLSLDNQQYIRFFSEHMCTPALHASVPKFEIPAFMNHPLYLPKPTTERHSTDAPMQEEMEEQEENVLWNRVNVPILAGNRALMQENGISITNLVESLLTSIEQRGRTVVIFAINGHIAAVGGISDRVRPNAKALVQGLSKRNIMAVMMTGDSVTTALTVAKQVGIDISNVFAAAKPEDKARQVRLLRDPRYNVGMYSELLTFCGARDFSQLDSDQLMDLMDSFFANRAISRRSTAPVNDRDTVIVPLDDLTGGFRSSSPRKNRRSAQRAVAMVGDGINDGPALATADVGLAIGAGAQVAVATASIVLLKSDPLDILESIRLAHAVFNRIRLNFVWALGYNTVGIPLAAGVFFSLIKMSVAPEVAGLAMALSSISVVLSSLELKRYGKGSLLKRFFPFKRSSRKSPFTSNSMVSLPSANIRLRRSLSNASGGSSSSFLSTPISPLSNSDLDNSGKISLETPLFLDLSSLPLACTCGCEGCGCGSNSTQVSERVLAISELRATQKSSSLNLKQINTSRSTPSTARTGEDDPTDAVVVIAEKIGVDGRRQIVTNDARSAGKLQSQPVEASGTSVPADDPVSDFDAFEDTRLISAANIARIQDDISEILHIIRNDGACCQKGDCAASGSKNCGKCVCTK